jgi:NADH-quinone oxidoreductase subunit L
MESLELIRNTQAFPWWGLAVIAGLPLLGALVNGLLALGSARLKWAVPRPLVYLTALGSTALSMVTTWLAWSTLQGLPEGSFLTQDLATWIEAGKLHARFSLQMDSLSLVMTLFVTLVGFLIHVYSVGYMRHDPGYTRYFAYLNLFMASMLVLVLSDNLLFLFVGWEGVGLCSYLLISFWFEDDAKAEAGKKAFLANRIGDAGFLVGAFVVLSVAGSLQFNEIQAQHHLFTTFLASVAAFGFLAAATGKSAQIPLFVWLPDAMAGPTPVSALIHAATMVTAGVYLMARLHFLFSMSPMVSLVTAMVGALTALMAALIASAQNDIKKVLAYSTISQVGFMFVAVGVGAFPSGIFHVMTHAFFKACLFLGAGCVIEAMQGEHDIRKMGGLLKHMPVTGIAFVAGWLAISGIPPFAGFFSKDQILWNVLATPNALVPWMPLALYGTMLFTSLLTAFYMTRLVALTFFGEFRGSRAAQDHLRESPRFMTMPLAALAVGSLVVGWLGLPEGAGGAQLFGRFLNPVFQGSMPEADAVPSSLEPIFMVLSFLVALLGIGLAWSVYMRKKVFVVEETERRIPFLRDVLVHKFWVDELYDQTVLRFVRFLSKYVCCWFLEQRVIEGSVTIVAETTQGIGRFVSGLSSGLLRMTVAGMVLGVALLLYWFLR